MKNLFKVFFSTSILAFIITSCLKDESNGPAPYSQNYGAQLNGLNAIPTNSSSATAVLNGIYNSNTQTLNFTIAYTGMAPTSWAIHTGAAGVVGPVVFPLGNITPSPYSGSVTLSSSLLSNLAAGLFYVNITSGGFPEGEVRGQIIKQ
jgi:hypothetical protein